MIVILDLGGVVFDVDWEAFDREMRERLGASARIPRELEDAYARVSIGAPMGPFIERLAPDVPVARFVEAYGDAYARAVRTRPEAIELVEELRGRMMAAAFSNTNPIHAAVHRATGLADLFDRAFFSCELRLAKPDPGAFLAVLAELRAAASECVFVDDSEANCAVFEQLGGIGVLARPGWERRVRELV